MTKMSKKDITNEQLARIIAKSFEATDKRFDNLDQELSGVKQDLENIELRIGHLAYAFEVKDLKKRVAMLERKVGVK